MAAAATISKVALQKTNELFKNFIIRSFAGNFNITSTKSVDTIATAVTTPTGWRERKVNPAKIPHKNKLHQPLPERCLNIVHKENSEKNSAKILLHA